MKPGDSVNLRVRRGNKLLPVRLRTVGDSAEPGRAFIGIGVDQAARIKLPMKVRIDAGNIGGPSAGLAFALEVMQKLGRNVDHGYRVAATGEIELDGTVAPIGGVKQKTYGVREAGADVFLVPGWATTRRKRAATPGRCASSLCSSFLPGVARPGNVAASPVRSNVSAARNCRKFVSFRLRQRLLPGVRPYDRTSRAAQPS